MDVREPALTAVPWSSQHRAALGSTAIVAGLVCGGGAAALVLTSEHYDDPILWAVVLPLLGWSFIGTGLFAWLRRPESGVGLLMMLVGFA